MSEPLGDRDIRAMLEARADRVPPAAAVEIRAAVSGRIVRRGGGLDVPVRPVVLDRPPLRRRAWWGAGLAAALVLAVSGLLVMGVPSTRDGTSGSGVPSAAASAPTSAPSPAPGEISMDAFRPRLASGELNARIVLLTGTLKVTPIRCLGDCQSIQVLGLDGVGVRYWSTTTTPADVRAAIEAHPGPSLMAFRVDVTDLVLLGWPLQPPEAPLVVRQLEGPATGIGGDDLAIVNAWLVGGSGTAECPATIPAQAYCPGAEPWLTDDPPGTDGRPRLPNEIVAVSVDPSLGLGQWPAQTLGLFLVRYRAVRGPVSPFEVIAHLDPATTIRVGATSLAPTQPGPLTAAQLRAGLDDGSLTGRLILVDGTLQVAAIPCPAPGGPQCLVLYLEGLEGVQVVDDRPLASTTDGPAPAAGRLLFRGGPRMLTYLGRAPDTLDPVSVAYLGESLSTPGSDALAVVSGWLVVGGIHSCPIQLEGATPCPGPPPWLTDDRPFENGMLASNEGTSVALTPTMSAQTTGKIVTAGPFLVRGSWRTAICDAPAGVDCSGAQWQVVAAFDPQAVVVAQVP